MSKNSRLGGGSLLLAWQLKDKRVLIVGGGDVASGRIESVLLADAFITLIAPSEGLHPLTKRLIDEYDRITYHNRVFSGTDDLLNVDMVLTAIDDVDRSREICEICRSHKIPINAADIPPSCDFYFGSQIRDGPLQIMISTNGKGPKLASLIKDKIAKSLPPNAGEAILRVGELRARLKERAPGVGGALGKRRMKWMINVCTSWEMDDLATLDDVMITNLLDKGWEQNRVPSVKEAGGTMKRGSSAHLKGAIPYLSGFAAGVICTTVTLRMLRC